MLTAIFRTSVFFVMGLGLMVRFNMQRGRAAALSSN
jgi:hypothetical protein